MDTLYTRIKSRRIELNLTQDEVAQRLGYKSRSTIAKIEAGESDIPQSKIESFASVLNTTPAYLMGWTNCITGFPKEAEVNSDNEVGIIVSNDAVTAYDAGKLTPKAQKDIKDILKEIEAEEYIPTHTIPVLGRVAAGLPLYAEQNIEDYTYAKLPAGSEYFALRVKGDSMTAARIFDNDIIIVREQDIVENGEIAVVAVNGDDATVKKFYREGNTVTLMPCSFNPGHQPQVYNTDAIEIKVIGKVILGQVAFE